MKKLIKEIRAERVTNEEKTQMIEAYEAYVGRREPMYSCASCGVRDRFGAHENFVKEPIERLSILKLFQEQQLTWKTQEQITSICLPIDSNENNGLFHPYRMRSVYTSKDGTCYHLHPEFVDNATEEAWLCQNCATAVSSQDTEKSKGGGNYGSQDCLKMKIPYLSIASGVDFGDSRRIGLTPLNTTERAILARVRQYSFVAKIFVMRKGERKVTKGHFISFDHNAPQVMTKLFDKDEICKTISL